MLYKVFSVRVLISIGTILLLIILLVFPKAALKGAENGILLWFNVIIPTLLPFIIVSNLIINLNLTLYIAKLFYPIFHKLFAVSKNGCYIIVVGLLTGFPVGAKACGDMVKMHMIERREGQYLLTFCNNASPMFIISYIAILTLNLPGMQYLILGIIYGGAIITALLYRLLHKIKTDSFLETPKIYSKQNNLQAATISKKPASVTASRRITFSLVDDAITDGFQVITKVGGYIILFSILANVILSVLPAYSLSGLLSIGILEITNGINAIGASALDRATKIALILVITAFGGFSSIAQTKSVIDQSGLSIFKYTIYKVVAASITLLFAVLFVIIYKL